MQPDPGYRILRISSTAMVTVLGPKRRQCGLPMPPHTQCSMSCVQWRQMGHQPHLVCRYSGHSGDIAVASPGLKEKTVLKQITHRPKNLVRIQSPATSALFRSEKSVLRYALRQNRKVATPPLVHCAIESIYGCKKIGPCVPPDQRWAARRSPYRNQCTFAENIRY